MTALPELPPPALSVDDLTCDEDWEVARRLSISVGGKPQKYVVAYDCEAGWLDHYVEDDRGELVVVGDGDDRHIKVERVHGHVTVEWKAD